MRRLAGLIESSARVNSAVSHIGRRDIHVANDVSAVAQVGADQDTRASGQCPDVVEGPFDLGGRVAVGYADERDEAARPDCFLWEG